MGALVERLLMLGRALEPDFLEIEHLDLRTFLSDLLEASRVLAARQWSLAPVPDLVALAVTLTNDGIVDIPGTTGTGVFAVATANVGAGETITASADTGTTLLPVSIVVCQTDPASGGCLAPPAGSVTTAISRRS